LLLAQIKEHSRRELHAAIALAVVLPGFALGFAAFFRGRILGPLHDLSRLLGLLARKDYAMAASEQADPLVRPLFEKYNRMVGRMRDLDEGHLKREDFLQQEVDQATRALFQQQAALARMERLAAVGEISARLGHELRNPLWGVLMALTNLRDEIDSQDQDERLALAIAELERIAHLLSSIVDESKQVPERPRRIHLRTLVGELVSLAAYQLDDRVRLSFDVPERLRCTLPEAGLRHALLNLVLNAAALTGKSGTIRIVARSTPDAVVMSVSDDGPGFPQDLLDIGIHDFGSWRRGGTGLGLAAVRRFAQANSGEVALENLSEGGACVTLRFPVDDDDG
jgi:two-component system NtrC family sensor kinase